MKILPTKRSSLILPEIYAAAADMRGQMRAVRNFLSWRSARPGAAVIKAGGRKDQAEAFVTKAEIKAEAGGIK